MESVPAVKVRAERTTAPRRTGRGGSSNRAVGSGRGGSTTGAVGAERAPRAERAPAAADPVVAGEVSEASPASGAAPLRRGRQRLREAIDTSDGRFLKVGSESEAKKVAGKIAQVVRDQGTPPDLLAAGPAAINQAVKAVAIAKQYLAEEEKGPIDLMTQPQFDGPSNRLTLHLRAVAPTPPNEAAEVLTVKRDSDPYKVAGAIAGRLRENKVVALISVGPDAVFHAVEAVAVARRYMAEDQMDIKFSPFFQQMDWEGRDSSGLRFDIVARKLSSSTD